MKFQAVISILLTIPFFFGLKQTGYSQTISVTGNWDLMIDETDLQGGPGTDLVSTYESNTSMSIRVRKGGWFNNWNWRVDVKKINGNWHGDFHLDVRRTGNGFGFGSISGGTSYQEISGTDQSFFSGSRNRTAIPFQYRLRGVSVQVVPNTYTTTVWFTVVEM